MISETHLTHLIQWSIDVQRNWDPHYYFNGERAAESFPPYVVNISAEFDNNDAALEFNQKVMAILEGMTGEVQADPGT